MHLKILKQAVKIFKVVKYLKKKIITQKIQHLLSKLLFNNESFKLKYTYICNKFIKKYLPKITLLNVL